MKVIFKFQTLPCGDFQGTNQGDRYVPAWELVGSAHLNLMGRVDCRSYETSICMCVFQSLEVCFSFLTCYCTCLYLFKNISFCCDNFSKQILVLLLFLLQVKVLMKVYVSALFVDCQRMLFVDDELWCVQFVC